MKEIFENGPVYSLSETAAQNQSHRLEDYYKPSYRHSMGCDAEALDNVICKLLANDDPALIPNSREYCFLGLDDLDSCLNEVWENEKGTPLWT